MSYSYPEIPAVTAPAIAAKLIESGVLDWILFISVATKETNLSVTPVDEGWVVLEPGTLVSHAKHGNPRMLIVPVRVYVCKSSASWFAARYKSDGQGEVPLFLIRTV